MNYYNPTPCFICGVYPAHIDGMCKKCKGVFGSPENVPAVREQLLRRIDVIREDTDTESTRDELARVNERIAEDDGRETVSAANYHRLRQRPRMDCKE